MSLGLAVTWDNPDIVIRKGGVIVPEHALEPDTEYEIEATIWNNSYEAPVVGLNVRFGFLTFGVATVETAIGATSVNVGVEGGAGHPALARMKWRTPAVPGHYCIQVALAWIDDANPANNLGQNNVNVAAAQSPAQFAFRLRNATKDRRGYRFEIDTYTLPAAPACPTTIPEEDAGPLSTRLRRIRARHDRAAHPVPPGWTVELVPPQATLNPDDEIDVAVAITPPPGFSGAQPFNVNAVAGDLYAGGVTLTVTSP